MRIRLYTEKVWNKMPKFISCFGECNSPLWISSDQVKDTLEMASLPGSDFMTFVVASDETVLRIKKEERDRVTAKMRKMVAEAKLMLRDNVVQLPM